MSTNSNWRRQWHSTPVLLPGKSHGRRAWKAAVHGVTEDQTWLINFTFTFHFHALEKEMATHSSVLAWRIPGTGEPGGLPSMGSHRVGHDWSDLAAAAATDSNTSLYGLNIKNNFIANWMSTGFGIQARLNLESWFFFYSTQLLTFLLTYPSVCNILLVMNCRHNICKVLSWDGLDWI